MADWNAYLNGILGQWGNPGPIYDQTGGQVVLPPATQGQDPMVVSGATPQLPPDSGDDFWGTKNPDGTSSYLKRGHGVHDVRD